jgi:hypothetical protein
LDGGTNPYTFNEVWGGHRLNPKESPPWRDFQLPEIMSTQTKKEAGLSGDLKTISLADLLQLISTSRKTGMLSISKARGSVSGDIQKREIYFLKGNITYATSLGSEDELLGKLILKKGKISKADLDKAVNLQKFSNKRLGTLLLEMGHLSREELMECLQYQIEEIIYNLFGWTSGEFFFLEGKHPPADQIATQINTMNMVMEGSRRMDEWNQIQKLMPPDNVVLRIVEDPKIKSSMLNLSLNDLRTLLLINGERTIPDILKLSPIGEFLTSKAIYDLLSSGLIEEGGKQIEKTLEKEEREKEELLLQMVTRLYMAAYRTIEKTMAQKLGEGTIKILNRSLGLQKTCHPILNNLVSSEDFLDFGGLKSAVNRISKPIRFHKLMEGLNGLLLECLGSVSMILGKNSTRQIVAEIRKESAQIIAAGREVAKEYELEDELFRTLGQVYQEF